MAEIFIFKSVRTIPFWGLFLFILIYLSKVPFRAVLRSVKPILFFVIFTIFIHLLGTKGNNLFSMGPFSITKEGCIGALTMSFRLLYLVLYAAILTLTTSPSKLSNGIESLMTPFKKIGFPAHEVAMMITIALRFIPTLFEETSRIIKSQLSRGVNFNEGGLIKRAKAYIPVLVPMFALVFMRADILATAMESRCYRGGIGKTEMYPLTWGKKENITIIMFIIISFSMLFLDRVFRYSTFF
ncbi:MAG: energy-coupling factor transporter transmembrane component T family protein [Synergistaceae bacterium]